MELITILVLVIVVATILVTIFLLLLRRRNARSTSYLRDGVSFYQYPPSSDSQRSWQQQEQQGSPGGWNQPGQSPDNAWGQSEQPQAGGWIAQSPAQQQPAGRDRQSPAQQQPAAGWGAQGPAQQQPGGWGSQSPVQQQPAGWGNQSVGGISGQPQQGASTWGQQSNQPPAVPPPPPAQAPTSSPSSSPYPTQYGSAPPPAQAPGWSQPLPYSPQEDPWSLYSVESLPPAQAPALASPSSPYPTGDELASSTTSPTGQANRPELSPYREPAKSLSGSATGGPSRGLDKATTQDKTDVHYSDASFPSHTVVGRMEALRVAITRKAVNTEAVPLPLERSSDDTQPIRVDAYVVVSPLDFDLESSNVQTIIVFPNADSAPVLFKLVAKSEGRKTIAVEFFQNTRYLGRAELETVVSQQVQFPRLVSALAVLEVSATQSSPDLTILFDRVPVGNDRHYYRYRLLSPIRELNLWFDEFHSPETSVMPQGFLEESFTQLNRLLSSDSPGDFFFGRLNSIGMNLYRRLFSDDFKRLYWNSLRYKVKSIVVISFEPWIPWELVRPFNPETNEADDGFLCEKFNLTRWLAGAGFPDTMSLEQLGLIISASDLDSARLEAEEIKQLLGSKVRDILSSGPSVYHLLRTNDFSGLHFACHGSFNKDNPDMSTLFLEDGTWLSYTVYANPLAHLVIDRSL
jgi:hypothetical protein